MRPTLANVFLCHFEEQLMSDSPIDYKPTSYRRYVDNTFLLFSSELHVTKFFNYMNSKYRNIKFTVEREANNSLSFLDIKTFRDSRKFQTSVYGKPTFSGVLTNFERFLPISYKYNLVSTLLHRGFMIWSSYRTRDFKQSALSDHLLTCDCNINFNNFTIFSKDSNDINLVIKEGLLISRDKSTVKSFLLELFE